MKYVPDNGHKIILFDVFGDPREVVKSDIAKVTEAPRSDLVLFADRYEMRNGDIWWTKGKTGWYDEHKLQGGLREIEYGIASVRQKDSDSNAK